jgi:hypothetical protein
MGTGCRPAHWILGSQHNESLNLTAGTTVRGFGLKGGAGAGLRAHCFTGSLCQPQVSSMALCILRTVSLNMQLISLQTSHD